MTEHFSSQRLFTFSKTWKVLFHVFLNISILGFWLTMNRNGFDSNGFFQIMLYAFTHTAVVYFNISYLFPRFLVSGKFSWYFILTMLTMIIAVIIQFLIYTSTWQEFMESYGNFPLLLILAVLIKLLTLILFTSMALAFKILERWVYEQNRSTVLENEKTKAELENLKMQTNPHFLFNTLNNIHVLTLKKPLAAGEMILGLADLMRYQLNESVKEVVPLQAEIKHIENYLTIEKIRKDKADISVSYLQEQIHGIMIQPLLLITLVENAVKHGLQLLEEGRLSVDIVVKEQTLLITVINSKPDIRFSHRVISSGKGLDNLRKRLQMAYSLKHELILKDNETTYTAILKITLV